MDIFVKLYNGQFSANPYTQVTDILEAKLDLDVISSSATIALPDYVIGIRQYNFIEVIKVGSVDEILFRGFITNILPEPGRITLACKGEKYILKYKRANGDSNFTSVSCQSAINTLFSGWNASFGDALSLSAFPTYTITSKQVKIGDNFYDFIEEIANANSMVWDCYKGAVRIVSLLGNDYTSGATVKELLYNEVDPTMNNVTSIKPELFSSSSSIVFATDGTLKSIKSDAASIALYGAIASEVYQIRKTDATGLGNEAQAKLDKVKGAQWAYSIGVDQSFSCELGAKVLVTIDTSNPYLDFVGSGIVNGKEMELKNGSFFTKYIVSDKYLEARDFYDRFRNIEKNLELRILQ